MELPVALITLRLFLRLLLGVLLLSMGLSKLAHPRRFQQGIQDYQLIPSFLESRLALSAILSLSIPVAELLASLGLFSGLLFTPALVLALFLLAVFSGAIFINLVRGRQDLSCHCGEMFGDHQISWLLLGRNGFLISALLVLLVTPLDNFTFALLLYHPSAWLNMIIPLALLVISVLVMLVLIMRARAILRTQ